MKNLLELQGESKKSRPPTTFNDIFAWAESLHKILHTYWQFISTYVYRFSFIYLNM